VPKEFAARLAAVPPLSRATYEQLARRPSSA